MVKWQAPRGRSNLYLNRGPVYQHLRVYASMNTKETIYSTWKWSEWLQYMREFYFHKCTSALYTEKQSISSTPRHAVTFIQFPPSWSWTVQNSKKKLRTAPQQLKGFSDNVCLYILIMIEHMKEHDKKWWWQNMMMMMMMMMMMILIINNDDYDENEAVLVAMVVAVKKREAGWVTCVTSLLSARFAVVW